MKIMSKDDKKTRKPVRLDEIYPPEVVEDFKTRVEELFNEIMPAEWQKTSPPKAEIIDIRGRLKKARDTSDEGTGYER